MTQRKKDAGLISLEQVQTFDKESLAEVGVLMDSSRRSGTYVLRNDHVLCLQTDVEGLEMLPISEALEKYPDIRQKYYSKLSINT